MYYSGQIESVQNRDFQYQDVLASGALAQESVVNDMRQSRLDRTGPARCPSLDKRNKQLPQTSPRWYFVLEVLNRGHGGLRYGGIGSFRADDQQFPRLSEWYRVVGS